MLARWPVGTVTPVTVWDADVVTGSGTPPGTVTTVLADPAFQGLAVNVWHRWGLTFNLATGEHIDFRITNGVTGVTTVHTPATPLLLPTSAVGAPLPTDFRFFTGGADNVFAIDNFTMTYAADFTTFGTGCPGVVGVPTLDAAAGSQPILGATMTLDLGNLSAGIGLIMTGLSDTLFGGALPLPLPLASFGFPGCDLLVDPVVLDVVIGAGTSASWSLALPSTPALAGTDLFNQGASLEPGTAFLAFSNATKSRLGF